LRCQSATLAKGQLISKCPIGVIVWTKIPTKDLTNFCPKWSKKPIYHTRAIITRFGSKIKEFPHLVHKWSLLYNINRSEKWGKKYISRVLFVIHGGLHHILKGHFKIN
jgi:hypothetical protein